MGIFDWLKKKSEKAPAVNPDPEIGESEGHWNESESISLSMSKDSVLEDTVTPEGDRLSGLQDESISNESITKGTSLIDTYEVVSDAIKGGMGNVWKVHHNGWNTDLAMKRPQPKFFAEGSEKRKEAFIHECESWINLGLYPNIVSCYYVRDISGVPTIFSEWMENGSLKNRIDDGTLYEGTEKEVQARLLDIAIQFARGLHYAHESKDHLIHQDVKPDNLLLTKNWEAKVADFGLAKARTQLLFEGAAHIAPTGGYTPAYCSFEQFLGKPLTRRTDIYSWAVSVLEMYIGKRPWKRGLDAGRNYSQYLNQVRNVVPQSLKDLLAECLAEKEEDRPHDFAVIEEKLKQIYREACSSDYPREDSDAAADTADSLNNRALSYLDLGKAEEAERLWEEAIEKKPDHLPSAFNRGLYQWRRAEIDDEELLRRITEAGKGNTEQIRVWKDKLEKERGISINCNYRGAGNTVGDFSHGSHAAYMGTVSVAITKDGSKAFTLADRVLQGWNVKTGDCSFEQTIGEKKIVDCQKLMVVSSDSSCVAFTDLHDGRSIIGNPLANTTTLIIASAENGTLLHKIEKAHYVPINGLCFHPDGRSVYTCTNDHTIIKWDVRTGKCVRELHSDELLISAITIRRDGKMLYSVCGDSKENGWCIRCWDNETGVSDWLFADVPELKSLCISPDGNRIYGCGENTIAVWNLTDQSCQKIPLRRIPKQVLLSADGKKLASVDEESVKIWDTDTFRCLVTFQDIQISNAAANEDLDVFLIGISGAPNCGIYRIQTTETIPFELSKIRSFHAVSDAQEQWNLLLHETENAIDHEDWDAAIAAAKKLEETIADGSRDRMAGIYRRFTRSCRKERLLRILESTYSDSAEFAAGNERFFSYPNGDLVFLNDSDRKEIFRIPTGKKILATACSPTEKYAAASDDKGYLIIIDIKNRRLMQKTLPHNGAAEYLHFSPDGKRLYSVTGGYSLDMWETAEWSMESGIPLRRSTTGAGIQDVCFSADGRLMAYIEKNGTAIRFFDLTVGKEAAITSVAFQADKVFFSEDTLYLYTLHGMKKNCYELLWEWASH